MTRALIGDALIVLGLLVLFATARDAIRRKFHL